MLLLPDTRPYPAEPVKSDLLIYATQVAHSESKAQRTLAQETLLAKITEMFEMRQPTWLSVALTMSPDPETYIALMNATNKALNAVKENEIQWFAMPVVIVAGAKQAALLRTDAPIAHLISTLENYPHLRSLANAQWLPQLIRADEFAAIKSLDWYQAKHNIQAAQTFIQQLPTQALNIPKDQSVQVLYAVGYGEQNIQAALGQSLRDAALPLMQVWHEHLNQAGLTLFTNPLNADTPTMALANASHMRQRMALDVFTANAIRAIRLQSPRVGVVMAAQEGGRLLFGFNATDSAFSLQSQVFTWTLSPRENIGTVQQNFLDLLVDCHVETIWQLNDVLPENADLPDYAQALNLAGLNPLFHEVTS